jgi:hypothetical protein
MIPVLQASLGRDREGQVIEFFCGSDAMLNTPALMAEQRSTEVKRRAKVRAKKTKPRTSAF